MNSKKAGNWVKHILTKLLFWSFRGKKSPKISAKLGFLSFVGNGSMTYF